MRAIYFERNARSPIHIHAGSHIKGVYIPYENVILYREQHGTFGGSTYSLTDRQELLNEMQPLLNGVTPNVKGVTYSEIKEFEYNGTKVKELIQNARLERELKGKVESGLDALLEQAK
jgi:hypothetical protein